MIDPSRISLPPGAQEQTQELEEEEEEAKEIDTSEEEEMDVAMGVGVEEEVPVPIAENSCTAHAQAQRDKALTRKLLAQEKLQRVSDRAQRQSTAQSSNCKQEDRSPSVEVLCSRRIPVIHIPVAMSQPAAIDLLRSMRDHRRFTAAWRSKFPRAVEESQYPMLLEEKHWEPLTVCIPLEEPRC